MFSKACSSRRLSKKMPRRSRRESQVGLCCGPSGRSAPCCLRRATAQAQEAQDRQSREQGTPALIRSAASAAELYVSRCAGAPGGPVRTTSLDTSCPHLSGGPFLLMPECLGTVRFTWAVAPPSFLGARCAHGFRATPRALRRFCPNRKGNADPPPNGSPALLRAPI